MPQVSKSITSNEPNFTFTDDDFKALTANREVDIKGVKIYIRPATVKQLLEVVNFLKCEMASDLTALITKSRKLYRDLKDSDVNVDNLVNIILDEFVVLVISILSKSPKILSALTGINEKQLEELPAGVLFLIAEATFATNSEAIGLLLKNFSAWVMNLQELVKFNSES